MRTLPAVLFLATLPGMAAEDKSWPQKGDTIYVAAELTYVVMMPFSGSDTSKIPACVPLTLKRASGEDGRWDLKSGTTVRTRMDIRLQGQWSDRLLPSEADCETRFKTLGQPKIVRTGNVHKIP